MLQGLNQSYNNQGYTSRKRVAWDTGADKSHGADTKLNLPVDDGGHHYESDDDITPRVYQADHQKVS